MTTTPPLELHYTSFRFGYKAAPIHNLMDPWKNNMRVTECQCCVMCYCIVSTVSVFGAPRVTSGSVLTLPLALALFHILAQSVLSIMLQNPLSLWYFQSVYISALASLVQSSGICYWNSYDQCSIYRTGINFFWSKNVTPGKGWVGEWLILAPHLGNYAQTCLCGTGFRVSVTSFLILDHYFPPVYGIFEESI